MTDLPDLYYMHDVHIDFAAYNDQGPMDLTDGKLAITLRRDGRRPFLLEIDTDDTAHVLWKDRAQGTGILTIPLSSYPTLPIGHIKLQMVAVDGEGHEEFQYLSWAVVKRTI